MDESRIDSVGEDGHDLDDRLDEVGSAVSVLAGGQFDADLELGDGHGGHGDVVVSDRPPASHDRKTLVAMLDRIQEVGKGHQGEIRSAWRRSSPDRPDCRPESRPLCS